MTELAVTDAHALWFYAKGEWRRLGRRARLLFERADQGHAAIYVPMLALVEIAEGFQRGHFPAETSFAAWVDGLWSAGQFVPVDLTVDIVLRAEELYAIPERGDRLIAATAVHLDCPLITRDSEIEAAAGVRVIW